MDAQPRAQRMIKAGVIVLKLGLMMFLLVLASSSFYAVRISLLFLFLFLVSLGFFSGSFYYFFLMIANRVNVSHEKYLFLALFGTYVAIIVFLAPSFEINAKMKSTALQNQNDNIKISESMQRSGGTLNSINETLNKSDISSKVGKNQEDHFVSNKFNSHFEKNKKSNKGQHYQDYQKTFTTNLILVVCLLIAQGGAWSLSTKIRPLPGLGIDVEAGAQPEDVQMQNLAPANQNLDLDQNPNPDPLPPTQPELPQNLVIRRICRPTEENNLEPREDLDGVNYESLAVPSPPMAAAASSTTTGREHLSGSNLSIAAAAASAAAGAHRAATAVAARSHRGDSFQSRSVVANPLQQIAEESFSQEETAETSF